MRFAPSRAVLLICVLIRQKKSPDASRDLKVDERFRFECKTGWAAFKTLTEIAKARKREVKDGKRVLFPVRLVGFEALRDWERIDSTGQDMAEEIRQYFIPDFSNWKDHDSTYRKNKNPFQRRLGFCM